MLLYRTMRVFQEIEENCTTLKNLTKKIEGLLKYFSSFAAVKIGKKKCAPSFAIIC